MDFKIAKIDGQDVLAGSTTGIYYTAKEWRQLTTDDSSQNLTGYHGRRVSATFARKRVVVLEGLVQRSGNANEQTAVQYLQSLFNLQSNTGSVQARTLYIKDMYDQEWTLNVKVREPVAFAEYDSEWKGAYWKWTTTLESVENPIYKSYAENSDTGNQGTFGGMTIGTTLGKAMDTVYNSIECVTIGNTATPARFVITCTDTIASPLKIANITDGTFFALDTTATAGDVIIVDSDAQTVTKNGSSIKASRIAGSVFPMIEGTTEFLVTDINNGIAFDHFTVAIYYRDALLA